MLSFAPDIDDVDAVPGAVIREHASISPLMHKDQHAHPSARAHSPKEHAASLAGEVQYHERIAELLLGQALGGPVRTLGVPGDGV